MKFMGQTILEGVPWYGKIIKTISNRRTCQVAPPPWYKDNPLFKPIKDWTDKELADEKERIRKILETPLANPPVSV